MNTRDKFGKQEAVKEEISEACKAHALIVLRNFMLDGPIATLVWRAAKTAHEAAGISREDFENSLQSSPRKWNLFPNYRVGKDPYCLSFFEWVNYLYYGGSRIIGKNAQGENLYARDQDAVMKFFGITPAYRVVQDGKRHFWCNYGKDLSSVIQLRNEFAMRARPAENWGHAELLRCYRGLVHCLYPLTQTQWAGQEECTHLLQDLDRDFYAALADQQ